MKKRLVVILSVFLLSQSSFAGFEINCTKPGTGVRFSQYGDSKSYHVIVSKHNQDGERYLDLEIFECEMQIEYVDGKNPTYLLKSGQCDHSTPDRDRLDTKLSIQEKQNTFEITQDLAKETVRFGDPTKKVVPKGKSVLEEGLTCTVEKVTPYKTGGKRRKKAIRARAGR